MIATGADALAGAQDFLPGGFNYADDAISMPLQCGTQWDSLAHVFYDGRMYNDRPSTLITEGGAEANSIDQVADGFVARGVLLDVARVLGVTGLDPGTPVTPEMLDSCVERCGVAVESGDVVLVPGGRASGGGLPSWAGPALLALLLLGLALLAFQRLRSG